MHSCPSDFGVSAQSNTKAREPAPILSGAKDIDLKLQIFSLEKYPLPSHLSDG